MAPPLLRSSEMMSWLETSKELWKSPSAINDDKFMVSLERPIHLNLLSNHCYAIFIVQCRPVFSFISRQFACWTLYTPAWVIELLDFVQSHLLNRLYWKIKTLFFVILLVYVNTGLGANTKALDYYLCFSNGRKQRPYSKVSSTKWRVPLSLL